MADPGAGIERSLAGIATELERSLAGAVRAGGRIIATELRRQVKARNRAQLRNMGGVRVGVRVKVESSAGQVTAVATGNNQGAWAVVNTGAGPHLIGKRRHPGAPGTGAWDAALTAAEPDVAATVEQALDRAVRKGFDS